MDQATTSKIDLDHYLTLRYPNRTQDGFSIPNNKQANWEQLLGRIHTIGTWDFLGLNNTLS